ncbi:MAG: ribonuclease P protein component [Chitinophagaceae bacterium]|nr:ribonuclease P protein component [Chitinophagaceae bacterium]MBL0055699.1 ribonuclease P protein component [Chitinophagaceae bacterium]
MEQKQRYRFGKPDKLKSRKQINSLFGTGKSFSTFPFKVIWMHTAEPYPVLQAGFTVSSRQFKKAVDRNRIKRLMREAYRLQKKELQEKLEVSKLRLAVFLIYVGNEVPEYELVEKKTASIIKRLIKIADEDPADHT